MNKNKLIQQMNVIKGTIIWFFGYQTNTNAGLLFCFLGITIKLVSLYGLSTALRSSVSLDGLNGSRLVWSLIAFVIASVLLRCGVYKTKYVNK